MAGGRREDFVLLILPCQRSSRLGQQPLVVGLELERHAKAVGCPVTTDHSQAFWYLGENKSEEKDEETRYKRFSPGVAYCTLHVCLGYTRRICYHYYICPPTISSPNI